MSDERDYAGLVEVTQEDREAAASCVSWRKGKHAILAGSYDESSTVQAFARHRATALETLAAENARLREALEQAADNLRAAKNLYECPGCYAAENLARAALIPVTPVKESERCQTS
jgi:hypothetical protein